MNWLIFFIHIFICILKSIFNILFINKVARIIKLYFEIKEITKNKEILIKWKCACRKRWKKN